MKRVFLVLFFAVVEIFGGEWDTGRWAFKVFLDDKEVGTHWFEVSEVDGGVKVETEAEFVVKVLLVTAYRYEHENVEIWDERGMVSIDATTNDNGKDLTVRGRRDGGAFLVEGQEEKLPAGLMSFAYWNPAMLKEGKLLNSQTGEFETVKIVERGEEKVEVDGGEVAAMRYDIEGAEKVISVWYRVSDGRWVALEAPAKGKRVIRYVIEE